MHHKLLLSLLYLAYYAHARADVTWKQPAKGDTLTPGENVSVKWSADKKVVSPSFRVCASGSGKEKRRSNDEDDEDEEDDQDQNQDQDDSSCGPAVWPDVKEEGDGIYSATLSAQAADSASKYVLRMEDDIGKHWDSPAFSFRASGTNSAASASGSITTSASSPNPSASTSGSTVNAASSDGFGGSESAAASSSANPSSSSANKNASGASGQGSEAASTQSVSGQDTSANQAPFGAPPTSNGAQTPGANPPPNANVPPPPPSSTPANQNPILASRAPVPAAALAVPLAAVGALLCGAVAFAFRHQQRMNADRQQAFDQEKAEKQLEEQVKQEEEKERERHEWMEQWERRRERELERDIEKGLPVPLYMDSPGTSRREPIPVQRPNWKEARRYDEERERDWHEDRRSIYSSRSGSYRGSYSREQETYHEDAYSPIPRRVTDRPPERSPDPHYDSRYYQSRRGHRGDMSPSATEDVLDECVLPPSLAHVRRADTYRTHDEEYEEVDLYDTVASRIRRSER